MQRHGSVFSFFLLFQVCFVEGEKHTKKLLFLEHMYVPFLGGPSPLPYHIFSLFLKSSFQVVVEFFPLGGGVGKTQKGPPEVLFVSRREETT